MCPAVGAEKEESPSHGFAAPLGKGAKGTGGRIATTSDTGHWFRNDRLQEVRWSVAHMGAADHKVFVGQGPRALP